MLYKNVYYVNSVSCKGLQCFLKISCVIRPITWCNNYHSMLCGMVHIKDPLLLIGKTPAPMALGLSHWLMGW